MPGMFIEEMSSMPPPTPSQTPREGLHSDFAPQVSPAGDEPQGLRSSGLHSSRTKPDRRGDRPAESERRGRVQAGSEHAAVQPGRHHDQAQRERAGRRGRGAWRAVQAEAHRAGEHQPRPHVLLLLLRRGACDQGAQEVILRLSPLLTFATIYNLILYLYFHLTMMFFPWLRHK